MKILFSDNTLWGLLNFRIDVIRAMIELGHTVVLVAPEDGMCNKETVPNDVTFIPIQLSRTGANPVADLSYYKMLKKIYKSERPDYIFHYTIKPNIYGTLAAKSLGIRSSAMIAGLGHVYTEGGIGNAIARVMYKYAMRFPENVMVLNQSNYDTLLKRKVVKNNKLLLLEGGEGVNLEKLQPLPYPSNKKLIFLMICRVLYEKGYAEYVEAATALKGNAIFRLMGPVDSHPSAVKRETIEADVASGAIEYIEFSPDVQGQIAVADCVVLPSYHEGLSRVLMEGLALARPVITTDIAGCRETVDDGVNGFLCKPRDAQSLIDTTNNFLALSPQERAVMGEKGRELAQEVFDENRVLDVYINIIKSGV